MKYWSAKLLAAIVCFCTVAAVLRSSAEAVDLIALYHTEIRPLKTGVYERSGYHFFHQRKPKSTGRRTMFTKIQNERAAMKDAESAIFAWLDEHEKDQLPSLPSPYRTMNAVGTISSSYRAVPRRFDLPCSIFGNESDENGEYFYAVAVKDEVLAAEVAKGKFATRPQTIRQTWRNVVRSLVKSQSDLDFFVAFGVYDFATLTAADRYGEKCFTVSECKEQEACRHCIACLRDAVRHKNAAAEEYVKFLDGLPAGLALELVQVPELTNGCQKVRVMLLSFASCPVVRGAASLSDLERCGEMLEQTHKVEETRKAFLSALENAPGSELMWTGLGETFLRMKCPHLAVAAFRNAIRLNRNYPFAADRMAEAYSRLGLVELSKGLALLTLGLTEEDEFLKYSMAILELVSKKETKGQP